MRHGKIMLGSIEHHEYSTHILGQDGWFDKKNYLTPY